MSREFTLDRHDFPIESDGNCMCCAIKNIFNIIHPNLEIDHSQIFNSLPNTTSLYLVNLISVLQGGGYPQLRVDTLDLPKRRDFLFMSLISLLQGGGICEIPLNAAPWIGQVLHEENDDFKDVLHSVVIYGYYQPDENKADGWLYVCDSFAGKNLFVPWKELYYCLYENLGLVDLNVFDLSFDVSCLVDKYSAKYLVSKAAKREILNRTPGRSKRNKLRRLVSSKELALRRQS